jgi:hypothetical protein
VGSSEIRELSQELAPDDIHPLRRRQAVIQSVQSSSVTIRLGGSTTDIAGVKCLGSYSPLAGETVWVLVDGPDLLVLGSLVARGYATATVATLESTAYGATTYGDLATPGPAVTIVTGAAALVTITCQAYSTTNADRNYIGFAISGATTRVAVDTQALHIQTHTVAWPFQISAVYVATALTPGSNTFTLKYRQNGASVGNYSNRSITVIPL